MESIIPIAVLFAAAGIAGCSGIPAPPVPVNARIEPTARGADPKADAAKADTVIVGAFRERKEYARKVSGNWETMWFVVTYAVKNVERGAWPHPEITFVDSDTGPTPDSGITVDRDAFPHRPGVVRAFWLDTAVTPARILRHEERRP